MGRPSQFSPEVRERTVRTNLAHAQAVIQAWRRDNEEHPKKGLGGLTPAGYARQLVGTGGRLSLEL